MYLLDTDIIIYALKGRPGVQAHLEKHAGSPMEMSVISLMELYFGAHRSRQAEAKRVFGVVLLARFGNLKQPHVLKVDRTMGSALGRDKIFPTKHVKILIPEMHCVFPLPAGAELDTRCGGLDVDPHPILENGALVCQKLLWGDEGGRPKTGFEQ